ncbi:DUF4175 family protein [Haliangium sp.]|uniref:DUF4175 family protein n=1 Tax=Haliangium sp. TaxID=2663208 RepID=UPI003D0E1933
MTAFARTRAFLDAVRRRLERRAAARAGLHGLTALTALAVLTPLTGLVVAPGQGRTVAAIALSVAGVVVITVVVTGLVLPRRRWRSDTQVARWVGRHAPHLASDLLSTVELGAAPGRGAEISAELTEAFLAHTATRLTAVDPGGLDRPTARRRLRRAGTGAGLTVAAALALLLIAPAPLARGWVRLRYATTPGPFAGARMMPGPLVGDMRVTLEAPAYTQRPVQVLASTSGDFQALPGTVVTIETRALVAVAEARVVFGVSADATEAQATAGPPAEALTPVPSDTSTDDIPGAAGVEVGPDGYALTTRFRVTGAGTYRFWLESVHGLEQVEANPRRIELEPDRAPRVELFAPAEELDVARRKRVELAYISEDDYGIAEITLVWEQGDERHERPLSLQAPGRRSAQDKFLWDLAELTLEPGTAVRYHLEVTDNDTVSGPKTSRSREFSLRVFSPRERHEQLVARQRELFEQVLTGLGGRLVLPPDDLRAQRLLHRDSQALAVELGAIAAALSEDELADRGLRAALGEMRERIDALVQAEARLLDGGAGSAPRRRGVNDKLVAELEDDALLLADWLDRQQMENLLATSDEIKVHQERIKGLFEELSRTGSAEVMAEIEREMNALEARMAELAQERSAMPEDVLDRFVNPEALPEDESQDCMSQVRELLAAGDAEGARVAMESCMGRLDRAAEAMEQALRALRGERFSAEEKRLAELVEEMTALAEDQAALARDADELWERYAEHADELMRDTLDETRDQVQGTLDKLRRRMAQVPMDDLTPFAQEEMEIVQARLSDVAEMLADGDLAEALAMARQARESIEIMTEELEAALMEEADQPWGERTREAAGRLRRAQPLADELVEGLAAHTPSPAEIMTPDDRRALERMRRRQNSFGERARRLGERATQSSDQLPGEAGQALAGGLEQAGQQMDRAGQRMRRRDPSGARQESRAAAETLQRTLERARGAARRRQTMDRGGLRDEPIRIPGADEYRAPEAFREDILEAMKREQAPDGFGDMVKRYYEELIR